MAQMTIRKLDDDLVRRLKIRAAEHGRSAEAEVRVILDAALAVPVPSDDDFWTRAAALRAELKGRVLGDSTDIIRAQRDERTRHFERLMRHDRR